MNTKRKKRKLNYKNIFIATLFLFLLIWLIMTIFINKNFKVEIYDKKIVVNESGIIDINFKATYKDQDVTESVKESEFVIKPKKDKYEITFSYKRKGRTYTAVRTIEIEDTVKPVITLNKGDVTVKLGESYTEPGFTAYDNLDKNITESVVIDSTVNTSEEGEYSITYTVKDSSGNSAKVIRRVIVSNTTPLDMSASEFNLNGYFENIILTSTADAGEEYADNIIYVSDSTFVYYKSSYSKITMWKKNGARSEDMLYGKFDINWTESEKTLTELFEENKPEMTLIIYGENCVTTEEKDFYIENYKTLINNIKNVSPNTVIIVGSILPVPKVTNDKGNLTNEKINKYNYYLVELCDELNVPFLNVAEVLKDSEGNLKSGYEYSSNDVNHLGENGFKVMREYIRTHAYIEKES